MLVQPPTSLGFILPIVGSLGVRILFPFQVELDNAISLVGWAPAAELAAKSAAAQRAAGVKERLEAQLMEALKY